MSSAFLGGDTEISLRDEEDISLSPSKRTPEVLICKTFQLLWVHECPSPVMTQRHCLAAILLTAGSYNLFVPSSAMSLETSWERMQCRCPLTAQHSKHYRSSSLSAVRLCINLCSLQKRDSLMRAMAAGVCVTSCLCNGWNSIFWLTRTPREAGKWD